MCIIDPFHINFDFLTSSKSIHFIFCPFPSILDWIGPVKIEFLKKLTYANLKRNLQEQIRYTLRNKNQDDVCEDLVMNLTDVVNTELNSKVGPEDVLTESQLEELQYALNEGARRILKTNRMERLDKRVKRAIEKTLLAPQVVALPEVCQLFFSGHLQLSCGLYVDYPIPYSSSQPHLLANNWGCLA